MARKAGIHTIIEHLRDNRESESDKDSLGSSTFIRNALSSLNLRQTTLRKASAASFKKDRHKILNPEESPVKRTTQEKEFLEKGKVEWIEWSVYGEHAIYLVTLIGAQAAQDGGSVWLMGLAEFNGEHDANQQVGKYIGIYFAFRIRASALVVQILILWIFCAIEVCRSKMHNKMAYAIFRSPMQFFETTPAGRILNCFSSDRVSHEARFMVILKNHWVAYLPSERNSNRFEAENEWRVDADLRAYFASINANRWLAFRLEFISSVIILGSAGFAIVAVTSGSGLSAGMVGLAMSYALQVPIPRLLNWIVCQMVETNTVSVERVPESGVIPGHRPSSSWPANGAVSFHNYSTRYRLGLDLVLKDISLDIKPKEKIGMVGRTGAGKSSLTLALFRIIEPATGNISIDSLNTSTIGLNNLRQSLAIIPQDASLFGGTVRDNLDPSGSNLSDGERALVSLARAILTPSNILDMDEATVETDNMLQRTIRERFRDRTILTIAHRLDTIIDSDRIIVLQAGRVAEFDTPAALIENKNSLFYSLVKEARLVEAIRQ
ncbi:ATP-binding cassette glutathione S-conjugate transporter ycf1 [Rhizina undulata]